MGAIVEFRILGPVELYSNGHSIDLGHPGQRCLLALLALEVNRVLPTARLVELMWGGDPPASARNIIAGYATHLRKVLPQTDGIGRSIALRSRRGGYVLNAPASAVDLHRFRQLRTEARHSVNHERAAAALREALRLWRGPVLANVSGAGVDGLRQSLEEERLATLNAHHDAELRRNRHREVLPALQELADLRPLDEAATRRLMIAHYRCGNLAAALDSYDRIERLLADQLGIRTTTDLTLLRDRIVSRDPGLLADDPARRSHWGPVQLPHDVPALFGREADLRTIDEVLLDDRSDAPTGTRVFVVDGMAGVGKTALAVRWAYQAAHRFPDGQLYVNLRGHHPYDPPLRSIEGLAQCLRALGVPAVRVPAGLDERIGLYRSLLAGRRVLVVLDDAISAEQVRPLLPSDRGCVALVTSRLRLSDLVARDGARQSTLDPLDLDSATALVSRILGPARLASQPDAAAWLAQLCASLPLALCEVGSRLTADPAVPLAEAIGDLAVHGPAGAGVELRDQFGVWSAFDLSYRALPATAQRLFHCLGLLPGQDFTPTVAAALVECDLATAEGLLARLSVHNLIEEYAPARFRQHELLRRYAADLVRTRESAMFRQRALRRILVWSIREAQCLADPRRCDRRDDRDRCAVGRLPRH